MYAYHEGHSVCLSVIFATIKEYSGCLILSAVDILSQIILYCGGLSCAFSEV